jgi:hypothetical protein
MRRCETLRVSSKELACGIDHEFAGAFYHVIGINDQKGGYGGWR